MKKTSDELFTLVAMLLCIAIALAGTWFLTRFVGPDSEEPAPIPVALIHIELPTPEPLPTPTPTPEGLTYDPAIPLSAELQAVLHEACEEAGVPVALALGVIEVESRFQVDAVSSEGCYGLMQLNPDYFPDKLSTADNLRAGIAYLGQLLERYGDTGAALTAYNAGYDTGRRAYAGAVLEAAEGWAR